MKTSETACCLASTTPYAGSRPDIRAAVVLLERDQ